MKGGLSGILVKDIMSKVLISVDASTMGYQIAKMMEQGKLGAIIVKKDNLTQGVITDRDVAIKTAVNKLAKMKNDLG